MTIEAVVRGIGQWSVWWLLPLLVLGSAVLWGVRSTREALQYHLWLRSVRRAIQRLERERNGWLEMGLSDKAAWLEWQRSNMWSSLLSAMPGRHQEEVNAYNRRVQALVDADY